MKTKKEATEQDEQARFLLGFSNQAQSLIPWLMSESALQIHPERFTHIAMNTNLASPLAVNKGGGSMTMEAWEVFLQ